mgnify:CR=1 FL=1
MKCKNAALLRVGVVIAALLSSAATEAQNACPQWQCSGSVVSSVRVFNVVGGCAYSNGTFTVTPGAGAVTSVTATAPLASSGGATPNISIASAIGASLGGTGNASYAIGDLLYASAATTLSRLADVAAGSYLRSGGVTTAPVWSTLLLPNAAAQGEIPVASAASTLNMLGVGTAGQFLRSAGAGATVAWSTAVFPNTATTGDVVYASASNTYANLADVAVGQVLASGGVGVAPAYAAPGGDITGAIGSVTVGRLQGQTVTNAVPNANEVLKFVGGAWAPTAQVALTAGTGLTSAGTYNGDTARTFAVDTAGATLTWSLAQVFNGAVTLGDALTDTITLNGSVAGLGIVFVKEANYLVTGNTSTTAGSAGAGIEVASAQGAPGSGATPGGASGYMRVQTSNGGAGVAGAAAGASGAIRILTGDAGANGGGGGASSGNVTIDVGAATGAATIGTIGIGNGANAPASITIGQSGATTTINNLILAAGRTFATTNVAIASTAPTISSGFGTTPSVSANNGTIAFRINVGTGGSATNGVIGLPTATTGWNCFCADVTTQSATVHVCQVIASTTTTATIANFNTAGAQAAWVASDILAVSCFGF